MRDAGGGGGDGEFVAIHPEAAEELAAAMQRAGLDALDLLGRVQRAMTESGESAPAVVLALDDAGEWGQQAAADLRWQIEAMTALDRSYETPGGMLSGVLPFATRREYHWAVRQALAGLDGVLADPSLRGHAGARAEAVARWAAGLAPGVLDAVAGQAPDLLGNLDGIPPATRYLINQRRVAVELTRVDSQLAGRLNPGAREAREARRAALAGLAGPGGDRRARQLLVFDPAGDGRAVEVIGDLTGADHVAVLVPGIGTELEDLPGMARNAQNLQLNAQRLAAPGQQVATVAWFGYDTPPGGYTHAAQAASTDAAQQGAPQLVDFLAGQGLADDVHTTVIGHSYGSVVTGYALAAGLAVDDAVVIGSPGVGQGVTRR